MLNIKLKNFKTIKEFVNYRKINNNLNEKELTILKVKITTAINQLVKMGFLTKEASKNDKRIQEIHITEKSENILKELIEANYG